MTKILVLGAGGVGGYFGGRLVENGADVTFLVREKREEILQSQGLRIESPAGNAILKVQTVTAQTVKPDYDVVLFTCKAYDLDDAIQAIRPAVGSGTAIVPLLNGMAHLDRLAAIFGQENVLGGTVIIQATLTQEGIVRHLNDSAVLMTGRRDGTVDPRAKALIDGFDGAKGIRARMVDNIVQRMWEKWVRLSALAGMTCLMRANVGEILRAPGGKEAMAGFFDKNLQIAAHSGYPIPEETYTGENSFITGENSTMTASMLRDIENGAPVESDQILGDLLLRAKNAGIDHPILSLSYTHLKAYEERRKSGRDLK